MKKLNFEKLDVLDIKTLKTIKGGYTTTPVTSNTITLPGGADDGDDGVKTDN